MSFVASVETTQVGPHLYSFFGTSRCHRYHTPLYNTQQHTLHHFVTLNSTLDTTL